MLGVSRRRLLVGLLATGLAVPAHAALNVGTFGIPQGSSTQAPYPRLPFLTPQMYKLAADPDDTASFVRALTAGATLGLDVVLSGGYTLSGGSRILVDLGLTGLRSNGGAVVDCSGMSADYAFQLFSSNSYDDGGKNATHDFSGIVFTGNGTNGRNGLLIGHVSHDFNSQLALSGVTVKGFDRNLELTDNCWRLALFRCISRNAKNYSLYVGTGLVNFGEALQLYDCMFHDAFSGTTPPKFYIGTATQLEWHGCSSLNNVIQLDANNMVARWFGGNLENPGASLNGAYNYFSLTAPQVSLSLYSAGITVNFDSTTVWTTSVILTNDATQRVFVNGCKIPDMSPTKYLAEQGVGARVFIGGPGSVTAYGNSFWPTGGGDKLPLGMENVVLENPTFGTGDLSGWTFTPFGAAGSTATVVNTDHYGTGLYCVEMVADGDGGNLTQEVPCAPNQLCEFGAMAKVIAPGGSTIGAVQLIFKDKAGVTLLTIGQPVLNGADWFWVECPGRLSPLKTASVVMNLNVVNMATIRLVNVGLSVG